MDTRLDETSLAAASLRAGTASALDAIRWAAETFGDRCCILSSMQDLVVVDLASSVSPGIPVVFLDNGYHFESTLETLRRVERQYDIDIEVVRSPEPATRNVAPGECCDRKVELLACALSERDAWISGLQRTETADRADAPLVGFDRRCKVKVNPLAQWNDADRAAYIASRGVIVHPLLGQGYSSIGCAPCTTPELAGARSGRWAGTDRTECGLHL